MMKFLIKTFLILLASFQLLLATPLRAEVTFEPGRLVLVDGQRENNITKLIEGEWRPLQQVFGGNPPDPRAVAATILKLILSLVAIIFLILVMYGGFLWMTAGGNADQIDKAKSTILHGVIGVGIIITAFAIARLVVIALGCTADVELQTACLIANNLAF